jgi:glycosyltransferase involved in cell wall biosynthesis
VRNGIKIGVVHRFAVDDVRSLSGTPYFMAKSLARHVGEVSYFCPDRSMTTRALEFSTKALNRVSRALAGRRIISADHNRVLSKRLARVFESRLTQSQCDVIFAPVASAEIAYLATQIPIVYVTDMNWADIVDYYPGQSSLLEFARNEGDRIEAAAIAKATALIYPSEWAARTATVHYGADVRKVHCIPFGANFEEADIPSRASALGHSLARGIALLWVGVDWQRKGGGIAYDCLMELLSRGVDAHLTVCGCVPPEHYHHPKVKLVPFLRKTDPEQRVHLSRLFLEANFFLLPTMADATPIVLCEASAHGLPSLVRETGGVGGAVSDGMNGYLLPPEAPGREYAEKILEIVQNPTAYDALVRTSRGAYEEKLNWDAWGVEVGLILRKVVEDRRT